jgi:hypothetical protein
MTFALRENLNPDSLFTCIPVLKFFPCRDSSYFFVSLPIMTIS